MSVRTMNREWRRLTIGITAGAVLAVGGQLGLARGIMSVVGLYSSPIHYGGNVALFAYGEGRVQAEAYWRTETEDSEEELYVVVARGVGALTDRGGDAHGRIDQNDPPKSNPAWYRQDGHEEAGEFTTFFAYHRGCNPQGCFDEYVEHRRDEVPAFTFTFDPLLRSAEMHGSVQGWQFDITWTTSNPLSHGSNERSDYFIAPPSIEYPGGGHSAGAGEDYFTERSLQRWVDDVDFSTDWRTPSTNWTPPSFPDSALQGARLAYMASARAHSNAGAGHSDTLDLDGP